MNNHLSKMTILFHWLTGLAFLTVLGIGLTLEYLPKGTMSLHKSLGTIVFVIAVLRLIWRFKEGSISSISKASKMTSLLATSIHHLLLLATLIMPLSGILMSIGGGRGLSVFGFDLVAGGEKIEWLAAIASPIHHQAVNFIIVALLLHIAGGLKHQFIDKDGTVSRMLGNFHK